MSEYRDSVVAHAERRHFYHLKYNGEPGEKRIHYELDSSDSTPAPVRFEFSWVPIFEAELHWDHNVLLCMLLQ